MALVAGLQLRQGQSLVMTPQLLQAIKLLQLSTVELAAHIEAELDRNPLLERIDDDPAAAPEAAPDHANGTAEWMSDTLETSQAAIEDKLDTDLSNTFDSARAEAQPRPPDGDGLTVSSPVWSGVGAGGRFDGDDDASIDGFAAARPGLRDVLARQLAIATIDPVERLIGGMIIDAIDEAGYLGEPVDAIAERLETAPSAVERVLSLVQGFEPAGIAARDLAECLAIQLRERDRFDPAMQAMIARLDLVARRDFAALQKLCGVDGEDLADMVRELRALDPKPGLRYAGDAAAIVVPDVFVRPAANGEWIVELNSDALPRILVDQAYYARVSAKPMRDGEKSFVQECWQSANWLTRSLEQRARTILKVASEIVRQQDSFLLNGVQHLKPLNLKTVADAIGMHESTVSRVTSNKFMATHRGLFEMKYFFSTAISATTGGAAHSAESVRFRIKQLIDGENPAAILSDDMIVEKLKGSGIDIARRTVAKYRESLRLPSSVERRREKNAMAPALMAGA